MTVHRHTDLCFIKQEDNEAKRESKLIVIVRFRNGQTLGKNLHSLVQFVPFVIRYSHGNKRATFSVDILEFAPNCQYLTGLLQRVFVLAKASVYEGQGKRCLCCALLVIVLLKDPNGFLVYFSTAFLYASSVFWRSELFCPASFNCCASSYSRLPSSSVCAGITAGIARLTTRIAESMRQGRVIMNISSTERWQQHSAPNRTAHGTSKSRSQRRWGNRFPLFTS